MPSKILVGFEFSLFGLEVRIALHNKGGGCPKALQVHPVKVLPPHDVT